MLSIPVCIAFGLLLGLFLRHWKVTLPLTVAWCAWFHPAETWQTFAGLPDIVYYTWVIDVVPFFGIVWDVLGEIYATWPGFIFLNLLGLSVLGSALDDNIVG